jgi:hypothetical protein
MRNSVFIAAALVLSPACALAQAPPSPATPPQQAAPAPAPKGEARDPRACTPAQQAPNTQNGQQGTVGQGRSLGERLAQTDGVICPPGNVDPEIRAPTPNTDTNRMPVIPPPGSPGGDPSTRPK